MIGTVRWLPHREEQVGDSDLEHAHPSSASGSRSPLSHATRHPRNETFDRFHIDLAHVGATAWPDPSRWCVFVSDRDETRFDGYEDTN